MSTLVSQDILRLAQEAANDIDHEDHDEAVRVALDVAAPYLIREARAAELEAAAESIYRQARVQLRSSDGSRWQLAHRSGYADGVILARQELRARAAAIRAEVAQLRPRLPEPLPPFGDREYRQAQWDHARTPERYGGGLG